MQMNSTTHRKCWGRVVRWAHLGRAVTLFLAVLLAGWPGPGAQAAEAPPDRDARPITVMTQNMDEATDFGPLFSATTGPDVLAAVAATYAEVQASKIPERAAAVAREIG